MKDKLEVLDQKDRGVNTNEEVLTTIGWIDINRKDISYSGRLYPPTWRFQVKPVTVAEIRHFSSIDEENPMSVNNMLNDMMKSNVRIIDVVDGRTTKIPTDRLYEHDRFLFLMFIHAYSGTEKAIKYVVKCKADNCDNANYVAVTPFNITYTDLDPKTESDFLQHDGSLIVNTKSYGKLQYMPITLSVSNAIKKFVAERFEKGDRHEQTFIKLTPFLTDPLIPLSMQSVYQKYLALDEKKFTVLLQLVDKYFDIRTKGQISFICELCGAGGTALIKFPNGLRNIFLADSLAGEIE